jgi:hypothetical protein
MASIAWTDVVDHAPELSTVDTDAQTNILAYVNTAMTVDEWGGESSPKLKLARIYLAAHYGTVTSQGGAGAAGPVTSETAGSLSREYASYSPAGSDPLLDTTPYGKAWRSLARTTKARAPQVI